MSLEQKVELLEKAVCILVDCISPMNQEILLTNRRIEQLEAICSELQNKNKKGDSFYESKEPLHEGGVSDCQG